MIKDTKHLKKLITQAKSESNRISSNKSQILQIESLSLQIHEKYLTSVSEQIQLENKISSLQLKLEENSTASDYYKDALIRLLIPQDFSLTLVYKAQGNIPYIKGRVYWDNKQREVQIGSIVNVISQIKQLCKDGLIPPIKGLEKKKIKWDYIKLNPEIESAVKYVGKIKFKQYLLKHFKFPKEKSRSAQLLQGDFTPPENEEKVVDLQKNENLLDSKDWYTVWRKDNL
ncbi:MAG: hypothetical protein H8E72_09670 [Candidatus Marinimicrobia bacterium]|nr:hypothetical protein [Candidatus Neomarinimicrobiota bacterium]